ncbi:hypothetical protein C8F04DRAFT_1241699 [Mycena alexandri]|uniref:Uncharacterized protein n=1 Tax=Mycena alexandri TaxID=1745969 RepID=A0AAD6S4B2_9AGAR|nr:hypothetical protein C8F04DRAFT_1241699 [Mycena alexandri]
MGSSISAMINQQQAEMKAQAQDQLNALLTMADLKYQNFLGTVKEKMDRSTVPVDKILILDHSVHAGVTNNADNLKKTVSTAGKAFASGEVLDGVTAVISAGLDAVFGNVQANESEHSTYVITCGDLGGIMRIDIDIFCYTYTSTALTKVTNNVVNVSYAISSVDVSQLDAETIRGIVQTCYGEAVPLEQLKAIYEEILAAYKADHKKPPRRR